MPNLEAIQVPTKQNGVKLTVCADRHTQRRGVLHVAPNNDAEHRELCAIWAIAEMRSKIAPSSLVQEERGKNSIRAWQCDVSRSSGKGHVTCDGVQSCIQARKKVRP